VEEIMNVLAKYQFEIVLVNDGSKDDSDQVCREIAVTNSHIKYIELARNFGEHNAVMCALSHCSGDVAIIMDDDFQNPPCELHKLISGPESGDVIYTKYREKKHHLFRNIGSKFNWLVSNFLLDKPSDLYLSSFKLIRRNVIDEIVKYKGPFPYVDGLILRSTDKIETVCVEHSIRHVGDSNYTLTKLISLWLNMFVNFSIKPLRIVSAFGLGITSVSILFAAWVLYLKVFDNSTPPGWASLMILLLFLFGILFIFMGLIGEYLGKQYLDQNGTPQWVIREEV